MALDGVFVSDIEAPDCDNDTIGALEPSADFAYSCLYTGVSGFFVNTAIATGTPPIGDDVTVSIRDTGRGISKEDLKRVFDPGFTTKGVGVGTGLGLSISYQINEDHNGRIEAESEPGIGSTFKIIIPFSRQQPET